MTEEPNNGNRKVLVNIAGAVLITGMVALATAVINNYSQIAVLTSRIDAEIIRSNRVDELRQADLDRRRDSFDERLRTLVTQDQLADALRVGQERRAEIIATYERRAQAIEETLIELDRRLRIIELRLGSPPPNGGR